MGNDNDGFEVHPLQEVSADEELDGKVASEDVPEQQEVSADEELDGNVAIEVVPEQTSVLVEPAVVPVGSNMQLVAPVMKASYVDDATQSLDPITESSPVMAMVKGTSSIPCSSVFFHLIPFLNCLSILDIDLDTTIPAYIADLDVLLYLARVPGAQPSRVIIGPSLPLGGFPLVPYEDSDADEDCDIMEIQGPLPTPCKRRARKLKEPLDTKFLRRSARTSLGLGGFRNKEAAKATEDFPIIYATRPLPWRSSPLNMRTLQLHLWIHRPRIFRWA